MKTLEQTIYHIQQKFQKKVYDLPFILKRKEKRMLETKRKHIEAKLEKEKARKLAHYDKQMKYEIDVAKRKFAEQGEGPKVKGKPRKKPKTITSNKMKEKLLTKLQYYSRLRDTDENGRGYCISCQKRCHFRKLQGGHFKSRKFNTTAFDLQNINAQCSYCNAPHGLSGNEEGYKIGLYNKYGKGVRQELEKRSKAIGSLDYQRMVERLEEVLDMIAELKKTKNLECFENG